MPDKKNASQNDAPLFISSPAPTTLFEMMTEDTPSIKHSPESRMNEAKNRINEAFSISVQNEKAQEVDGREFRGRVIRINTPNTRGAVDLVQKVDSPRAEEVYSPRAEEVYSPRAEEVDSPRAEEVYSPRAEEVDSPRAEEVDSLRAEAGSKAGSLDSVTSSTKSGSCCLFFMAYLGGVVRVKTNEVVAMDSSSPHLDPATIIASSLVMRSGELEVEL